MLKSMTGFGRSELDSSFGRFTAEIKSVNHRYCNIVLRVPPQLSNLETHIHNFVKERVSRGQLNVVIELATLKDGSNSKSAIMRAVSHDYIGAHQRLTVDVQLAEQYHRELSTLRKALGLPDDITLGMLTRLPGIFVVEEQKLDEEQIWPTIERLLTTALDQLDAMKRAEGAAMHDDLQQRLKTVAKLLSKVRSLSMDFMQEYYEKLKKRLQELLKDTVEIDESRIIMEAGILAERADITEELIRLESHCGQFSECLTSSEPVGRQLDFLLQEMLREVNTTGSKANSPQISTHSVSLKTEIEKMRELVQNVE